MRRRNQLILVWGTLALLSAIAFLLGRSRRPASLDDQRPSSLLTGPYGARGLADALERLGIAVERSRRRIRLAVTSPASERTAFVLLEPWGLEPSEVSLLAGWHAGETGGHLVLAGSSTDGLMACFGWTTGDIAFSPLAVSRPGEEPDEEAATAAIFLVPDSSIVERTAEEKRRLCDPVPIAAIDTLLVARNGRLAAIRLHRADLPRTVLLISEVDLLRNSTLRETSTGPAVLSLFSGQYDRVVFEEAGHGFGTSGSLSSALLEWSRRTPWGWAAWQLAIVGLIALLAGAIRFGPVRAGTERRRRSPLEHVRALATALGAARGHDVAITALIRGLRRRLVPTRAVATDPREWLADLSAHAQTPAVARSASKLMEFTRPGQPAEAVLQAANTVEDLWEGMHR